MLARVKKNDEVQVIAGAHKGKRGKVLELQLEKGRVLIQGVNLVKKHVKASAQHRQGGIIEKEASVALSNVLPWCGKCGKPVRLKAEGKGADKKRACAKCGTAL